MTAIEHALRYGRVFFVYDSECCQHEADDPEGAVCFLLPRATSADAAVPQNSLHLICQLMGTALFTERNMSALPSVVRLKYGQFVLLREGRFVWAMHTSADEHTRLTRQRLGWVCRVVRLLHGGLMPLWCRCGEDVVVFRERLHATLLPLLSAGEPFPLCGLFDVPPRLDWPQKDDLIGQKVAGVQAAAAKVAGCLTTVLCWDGQIISHGSVHSFSHLLSFVSGLPDSAFVPVDGVSTESGTVMAAVYVEREVYDRLHVLAEPLWPRPLLGKPSKCRVSSPPPLSSIEEKAESSRSKGSSSASFGSGADLMGNGQPVKKDDLGTERHHRRRRKRSKKPQDVCEDDAPSAPPVPSLTTSGDATISDSELRSRIGALALRALSAECGRAEPTPPPAVDQIPVRRLRRAARRRASLACRRSLSDLDVPEPFTNLAFLRHGDPEQYRDELRRLQTQLRDNAPAFSAVPANTYSFGIPRSNRLYTPRHGVAASATAGARWWRNWRSRGSGGPGYASEAVAMTRPAPAAAAARRRFHSEGEHVPHQPGLLRQGSLTLKAVPAPADLSQPRSAVLYIRCSGKLRLFALLDSPDRLTTCTQARDLHGATSADAEQLEALLNSYRSIPSFHGQHYSYACYNASAGGQLDADGASRLDLRLLQLLHQDLQSGQLTDCRIRTPSDVVLAQRHRSTEVFYQQPTAGHQHGLPVVNGPLSKLEHRARDRLAAGPATEAVY